VYTRYITSHKYHTLSLSHTHTQTGLAASSDASASGNGAAAADKAAAEKEANKAAMTAELARSLAERVKVLDAQLVAAAQTSPIGYDK